MCLPGTRLDFSTGIWRAGPRQKRENQKKTEDQVLRSIVNCAKKDVNWIRMCADTRNNPITYDPAISGDFDGAQGRHMHVSILTGHFGPMAQETKKEVDHN